MKLTDLCWLLSGVILNAAAQLGLKAATHATGAIQASLPGATLAARQLALSPAFWLALCAYAASLAVWIVGLSRVPVSQAYPVLSIGYVITALLAWATLGETLNFQRACGIVVIIAGVWLVTRS
jgi:multidrug transporter EmrE-like cation transporter